MKKYQLKANKYNFINMLYVDSLLIKKNISRLHNNIIIKTNDKTMTIYIKPIERA